MEQIHSPSHPRGPTKQFCPHHKPEGAPPPPLKIIGEEGEEGRDVGEGGGGNGMEVVRWPRICPISIWICLLVHGYLDIRMDRDN